MRTTIIALAVLAISLTAAQAPADYDFTDTYWYWSLEDYPRWHYGDDYGYDGQNEPSTYLYSVQFGIYLSENTLVEPNVLNFHFIVSTYDEQADIYFDINAGEDYIEQQVDCGFYSDHGETYDLILQNTIPEGGGWVVFDEENSWIHRVIDPNYEVEPESLGNLRALFN